MELWFTERHTPNIKFSIKVDHQLYSGNSEFQRIDIFDSKEFGRFLTLDGYMMLTEKDEFIYHEMITHVPMAVHANPKNILVIGAGDGGVVRELTRYASVESIDLVEIDELVVEVCKKYLPTTACRFDDPRVHVYYEDGVCRQTYGFKSHYSHQSRFRKLNRDFFIYCIIKRLQYSKRFLFILLSCCFFPSFLL